VNDHYIIVAGMNSYLHLIRLHQPTGIWLLLWPCWWSLALASDAVPPPIFFILFGLGAVLMRGAGCIVNDIADREFDKHVERTKTRPLASGELSLKQAVLLLCMLLAVSLWIAMLLGTAVLLWAALSLPLVALYPLMKRISWWPQLFLGFTFNWGALMGWAAMRGTVELPALVLYAGCVFWTLGYDTIYAHQDKTDDARIGVKSTALRLGQKTKPAVLIFYALAALLWGLSGWLAEAHAGFYVCLAATGAHLLWQVKSVDLENPISCRSRFAANSTLGWLMLIGLLL
jgi:4-hydroxybenzoate polyprenyltransferase